MPKEAVSEEAVLSPGGRLLAGQMPLRSKSGVYDEEKSRYLEYCRSHYKLGNDTGHDHAPPIELFEDDYHLSLRERLGVPVRALPSWNHFWREGEPARCSWRVDYLLEKENS